MKTEAPDNGRGTEIAYRAIRARILSGQLAGGEWLREGDLAEAHNVSRTPIREALRRLAAEGLVEHERNRGVRVKFWSDTDLDEIFSIRSVLEPWGCALAATRGAADTALLADLATRMNQVVAGSAPDYDELTDLNNLFHRTILEASGNSHLVTIMNTVIEVPLVRRTFEHYPPPTLARSLSHHHEIVIALEVGDAAWAESVMRAHVRSAWSSLRPDHPAAATASTD